MLEFFNFDPDAAARRQAEKQQGLEQAKQTLEALETMKKREEEKMLSGVIAAFARRNRGGK